MKYELETFTQQSTQYQSIETQNQAQRQRKCMQQSQFEQIFQSIIDFGFPLLPTPVYISPQI